jgi:hypothetical protein
MRETETPYFAITFPGPVPEIIIQIPALPSTLSAYGELSVIHAPTVAGSAREYAKELLDRLRYLKSRYVSAYGPGSVPPSAQAFQDAEVFIRKLPLNRMSTPIINVASDGEVNFDWSKNDARVDLGFYGNGTYSFYGRSVYGEIVGEDVDVGADVPKEIIGFTAATG